MSSTVRSLLITALLSTAVAGCPSNRGRTTDPAAKHVPDLSSSGQPGEAAQNATPSLSKGDALPKLARDVLQDPMRRHGDNLESLLWTALMLDYESTAMIAGWIAEEPRLSRPGAQMDALNAELPAQFFQLQDQLHRGARDLARAARERDDEAMADAFSRLAGTCMRCHSVYLRRPALPEE